MPSARPRPPGNRWLSAGRRSTLPELLRSSGGGGAAVRAKRPPDLSATPMQLEQCEAVPVCVSAALRSRTRSSGPLITDSSNASAWASGNPSRRSSGSPVIVGSPGPRSARTRGRPTPPAGAAPRTRAPARTTDRTCIVDQAEKRLFVGTVRQQTQRGEPTKSDPAGRRAQAKGGRERLTGAAAAARPASAAHTTDEARGRGSISDFPLTA